MSSEIKVDTISENTSAGGVTIDSLAIKDGKVTNLMNSTLNAADMGAVHIKVASSGDTAIDSNNDDLVIENDNHAGITISTPNDKAGGLYFSDPDDSASGRIVHDHSANTMVFQAGNLEFLRTDSSRKLSTGGEDAADCDAGGLTLDQNANDAKILTLKSSDVAHGQTSAGIETDTYLRIQKESSASGGCLITGITENGNIEGLKLSGYFAGTSGNTGKSTSQASPLVLQATNSDGSGDSAELNSNENMVCILNRNTCRFIFDADGDFHADSGSTTYDAYEDAHLVRAYDLSHGKGVIDSKFDKFVSYNHEKLADLQLVGREDDGTPNHFINVTGMQRLHNGAIWQQYEKHQRLANAVYELAKAAVGEDKANEILEQNDIKLLN
jgi:hypothetical protein